MSRIVFDLDNGWCIADMKEGANACKGPAELPQEKDSGFFNVNMLPTAKWLHYGYKFTCLYFKNYASSLPLL